MVLEDLKAKAVFRTINPYFGTGDFPGYEDHEGARLLFLKRCKWNRIRQGDNGGIWRL